MTQPAPQIQIGAATATTPDGTSVVQLRIVAGPTAYLMELPPDAAEQLAQQIPGVLRPAIDGARRANLGAPGLILPTNGAMPALDPRGPQHQ